MRCLVGLCLVAACGPKAPPAEPLVGRIDQPQSPYTSELPRRTAKAERPLLDISAYVPDFHDELRWPLTGMSHPVLEPRFNVAQELAEPGIDWQELCDRGVQNRVSATQKELLEYLHGWCDVARGDIDAACKHLVPLIGSTTRNLTPAVRLDLANILAAGSADKAEHWVTKHNIRDIQMLDLLAANYAEQGLLDDAAAVNHRIIDSDDYATPATKCRRLTRQIAARHDADETMAFLQLDQLATKPKTPDPVCVTLFHKAECFRNPENCDDYFDDEKIDRRAASFMKAYALWPKEGTFFQWWEVVASARYAVGMPAADELLVTALDAAVRAEGGCPYETAADVNEVIRLVLDAPDGDAFEPRLKQIAANCRLNWAKFHAESLPPTATSTPVVPSASAPTTTPTRTPRSVTAEPTTKP